MMILYENFCVRWMINLFLVSLVFNFWSFLRIGGGRDDFKGFVIFVGWEWSSGFVWKEEIFWYEMGEVKVVLSNVYI